MRDGIPWSYWTFRTAWTVLHFVVVLVAVGLLLRWALDNDNAKRLLESAWGNLLEVQRRVGEAIPWPWD